jgi:hypothetical protein
LVNFLKTPGSDRDLTENLLDKDPNLRNLAMILRKMAKYYLERAAERERLAGAAMTEENREILLRLVARWRAFASERDSPAA